MNAPFSQEYIGMCKKAIGIHFKFIKYTGIHHFVA
jgi:hypothetical protein